MKKHLLFLVFILQGLILQANHRGVELSLSIFDNSRFTLVFDGMYLGNACNTQIIENTEPGTHYLQVMRISQNHHGYGNMSEMIFRGYIEIPNAAKVFAFIDRQGRFRIREVYPAFAPQPQVNVHPNFPGHNSYGYPNQPGQFQPIQVFYGPQAMNPAEFESLVKVIENRSFDSSKLTIAKQALSSNKFSSAQVLRLVELLTFESYKLDLAKFAYNATIDKNNYHIVYNGFTFNSSINELAAFISHQPSYFGG